MRIVRLDLQDFLDHMRMEHVLVEVDVMTMENISQHGFSSKELNIILASFRLFTLWLYATIWTKFFCWCQNRKIT